MKEKERGRRKKTERARKWRVWALMMRFDSEKTVQRSIEGGAAVAMEDLGMMGWREQRRIRLIGRERSVVKVDGVKKITSK